MPMQGAGTKKVRPQTHGHHSVKSEQIFKKISLEDFLVNLQLSRYKMPHVVATYLRCCGVVNNQIKKCLLLSLSVKKSLKLMNIWQRYNQERGCLVHFMRLATTLQKVEQSARDNHSLA